MNKTSLTFKVAILAIGKTVKRLIGTISILILVRLLTQEDFGTYKQILLIIGLVVVIAEFSIPKSLLYFVSIADNKDERNGYLSQSFGFLSIIGVISSVCLYLFADVIANTFNNPNIGDILKVYAPSVIFLLISQNYFSYMLISMDKHKSASYSFVFVGLPNAISIVISVVLGYSLIQVFMISLSVMAIQYTILIYLIKKLDVQLLEYPHRKLVIKQWKYILPLSFTILSGIVAVQFDKLIISYYFTPAVFAVYAIGAMQVPFVSNLFESVNATITPNIAKYVKSGETKRVAELSRTGTRKVSLLIFPIFCFLFIYADQIITLLFTHNYIGAVPIFRVYLFVILMKISFCGAIILGSGQTGLILKTSIFTTSLNVCLNFLLVIYLGLIGPAIATVVSRLLHQGLFVIWVKNILGYNISEIFAINDLARILVLSMISADCSLSYFIN